MDLAVLDIEIIQNNERIKGIATIELKGILKVAGIKILQGNHNLYCCCPNSSFTEKGLRKWANILTFERSLWTRIQEEILKKYDEKEKKGDGRKA